MIYSVLVEDIETVWPNVKKYIDKPLEKGNTVVSSEDILAKLLTGHMQLYVVDDGVLRGAFTTEVEYGSKGTILRCVTLSGDGFDDWAEHVENILIAWSKELNSRLQIIGRIGWLKHKKRGKWKPKSVIMEYENE